MEHFTPLDFLRSLCETFERNAWKSVVIALTTFLKINSGIPNVKPEPAVPEGVDKWVNRKNIDHRSDGNLERASRRLLHQLGESDSDDD